MKEPLKSVKTESSIGSYYYPEVEGFYLDNNIKSYHILTIVEHTLDLEKNHLQVVESKSSFLNLNYKMEVIILFICLGYEDYMRLVQLERVQIIFSGTSWVLHHRLKGYHLP
jgi:hypothetical protein